MTLSGDQQDESTGICAHGNSEPIFEDGQDVAVPLGVERKNAMSHQPDARLALGPTQRELFEALSNKHRDTAVMYQAGVAIIKDELFPDRLSIAAHAFRELMEKLPNEGALIDRSPDLNTKVNDLRALWNAAVAEEGLHGGEAWQNRIGKDLRAFLDSVAELFAGRNAISANRRQVTIEFFNRLEVAAVPLPKDVQNQNAKDWMDLRRYFTEVSHHRFAPAEADFLGKVDRLEGFLSALLIPRPTADFAAIDVLLQRTGHRVPTPETVKEVMEQIRKSAANYRYFFETAESPSWLSPLARAGLFTTPPGREEIDGGFFFPDWAASQYLNRMARIPAARGDVLAIVSKMQETENVNVQSDLLDIALALPAAEATKTLSHARAWVQSPYEGLVKYHVGDLIAHLATGGETRAALRLAKEAFALRPAGTPAEDDADSMLVPEPGAWLQDWHYDEALKKALPALLAGDARRTLELLCGLLVEVLVRSRNQDDADRKDYSFIWHEAIENDEQPPRVRNSLISAIRNAAEQTINVDPANCTMVLELLHRQEWTVFKRITLHVLRLFLDTMLDDVAAITPELVDLERPTRHEAARLLRSAFPLLRPDTQEAVLERIAAGPDEARVVRGLEFVLLDPSPEKIAEYGQYWRAERYSLIAEHVPEGWRAEVSDVLGRAGNVRRPDEVKAGAMWHAAMSPKSADDLIQIGPGQTLAYVREWTPKSGLLEPTSEGLGRILTEVIADDVDGYVAQAEGFRTVDPTYVRAFFSGLESAIKQKKTFAWPPALELASSVVTRPREIPERDTTLMEADPDWSWTRGTIAALLQAGLQEGAAEIPFSHRELVWEVIEPLTTDPDPTPEHEAKYGGKKMDPSTMAINTVRGKAFNALIAYALWVRRNLDRLAERAMVTFAAIPEVRRVLDEHLDVAYEPSLTIRSVYGRYFPWIQYLDPDWTKTAVARIFPDEPEGAELYAAAWEAYLMACPPYREVLPILRPEYARAASYVASCDTDGKQRFRPALRLGEHLVEYYWQGAIFLDDSLLVDFFRLAPDAVRGHAMEYVGRSLANEAQELAPAIAQRLRELWDWRLQAARNSGNLPANREELAAFGWWFASRRFEDAWSMVQLRAVLDATHYIKAGFKVGEILEALAPAYPSDAVACVARMAEAGPRDWTIYGIRDRIIAILRIALASGNVDARADGERLVEYLVARGHFEFRDLLA